jgi:hypothetical protein
LNDKQNFSNSSECSLSSWEWNVIFSLTMSQCYDLRFPELSLILAQNGADILTYPSAFTFITGAAHWEVRNKLLKRLKHLQLRSIVLCIHLFHSSPYWEQEQLKRNVMW